jgi:hypothetical protein
MSIQDKPTIKAYFETGDKPTQAQFAHLIDSAVGKLKVPLAFANPLVTDLTTGYLFTVTVTGNMKIENPTGAIDGNSYTWWVKQDGVGGHAITLGTKFKIPSSATTPLAWSTAAGAMDMFVAQYDSDADLFYVVALIPGY